MVDAFLDDNRRSYAGRFNPSRATLLVLALVVGGAIACQSPNDDLKGEVQALRTQVAGLSTATAVATPRLRQRRPLQQSQPYPPKFHPPQRSPP